MSCSKPNLRFAKKHGAKVVPFKKLPLTHQLAIAYYMVIDGEAWNVLGELDLRFEEKRPRDYSKDAQVEKWHAHLIELLRKSMPEYIEEYGHIKFGMVTIPVGAIKEAYLARHNVYQNEDERFPFETFDELHQWYLKHCGIPKHPRRNRWPSILSCQDDELLEDGYHRFHSYIEHGYRTIPCVFFI